MGTRCRASPSYSPISQHPILLKFGRCPGAKACIDWAPRIPAGGGGGEIWAATQAGFACFCGVATEAEKATVAANKLPFGSCNTPCTGSAAEVCGAGNINLVMKISCHSQWGWTFVLLLCLGVLGYVGGFAAHAHKVKGQPLGKQLLLPHRAFWAEAQSLVRDGLEFTRRRAAAAAAGGSGSGGADSAAAAAVGGTSSRSPPATVALLGPDGGGGGGGGGRVGGGSSGGSRPVPTPLEVQAAAAAASGPAVRDGGAGGSGGSSGSSDDDVGG